MNTEIVSDFLLYTHGTHTVLLSCKITKQYEPETPIIHIPILIIDIRYFWYTSEINFFKGRTQ